MKFQHHVDHLIVEVTNRTTLLNHKYNKLLNTLPQDQRTELDKLRLEIMESDMAIYNLITQIINSLSTLQITINGDTP